MNFLCIVFDKIIFSPNDFSFIISLLSIYSLFVLTLNSILSFFFMNFYIIFNSLHYNLLVKILFGFRCRFVRIMLKLNSLSYAVHLEGLKTLFKTINFFIS